MTVVLMCVRQVRCYDKAGLGFRVEEGAPAASPPPRLPMKTQQLCEEGFLVNT